MAGGKRANVTNAFQGHYSILSVFTRVFISFSRRIGRAVCQCCFPFSSAFPSHQSILWRI